MDFNALITRVDDITAGLTDDNALVEFKDIREKIIWTRGEVSRPGCPPVVDNPQPGACQLSLAGLDTEALIQDEIMVWIRAAMDRWGSAHGE